MLEDERFIPVRRQLPSGSLSGLSFPTDFPRSRSSSSTSLHNLQVAAPEKFNDGQEAYFRYPLYDDNQLLTYHRYTHFEWFKNQLNSRHPGCIVPSLPEKEGISAYWNTLDAEFLENRRYGLEKFVQWLQTHPKLSKTSEVMQFISEDENEYQLRMKNSDRTGGSWLGSFKEISNLVSNTVSSTVTQYWYGEQIILENDTDKHYNRIRYEINELLRSIEELDAQTQEFTAKIVAESQSNNALMKAYETVLKTDPGLTAVNTLIEVHKEIADFQANVCEKMKQAIGKELQHYKRLCQGAFEALIRRNSIRVEISQGKEFMIDIRELNADLSRDFEMLTLERKKIQKDLAFKFVQFHQELREQEGSIWAEASEKLGYV